MKNIVCIKITKCSSKDYWYNNKIGTHYFAYLKRGKYHIVNTVKMVDFDDAEVRKAKGRNLTKHPTK